MENSHSFRQSDLASESRFAETSSFRNDRSFAHEVNQHSDSEPSEIPASSTENQYTDFVCRDTPQNSTVSLQSRTRIRSLEFPAVSSSSGYALPSVSETTYSDRFIPIRSSSNFSSFDLIQSIPSGGGNLTSVAPVNIETRDDSAAAYSNLLRNEILSSDSNSSSASSSFSANSPAPNRLFRYKNEKLASSSSSVAHADSPFSLSPIGMDSALCNYSMKIRRQTRKIARSPFKVLDAPSLQDDFYLNLVDWSNKNILAVGLGTCVYLWNASDSKVTKLCDLSPNDSICSVGWSQHGTYLAVGTNEGDIQIWDINKLKKLREMKGHSSRVGALSWSTSILSTGSRDRNIFHRDVRSNHNFDSRLTGHKSEICGLKWSFDGKELASGGNDNQLLLWNLHSTQPLHKFDSHNAAVKAIAWSPHQHNLLVSGAGTADRCIRFWNTTTLSLITRVDTGSQVCNLAWSKNVNEIISTHGYSQNQIVVWRYPLMSKLATLTGHSMRVLYLAVSPDGQTIVTGAGDETLRFWNVFPSQKSENSEQEYGIFKSYRTQIR